MPDTVTCIEDTLVSERDKNVCPNRHYILVGRERSKKIINQYMSQSVLSSYNSYREQ